MSSQPAVIVLNETERWPLSVPNMGAFSMGPATRCLCCRDWAPLSDSATWSYYGKVPLCLRHAKAAAVSELAWPAKGGRS